MSTASRHAQSFFLLFACTLPACHPNLSSTATVNKVSEAHEQAMYFTNAGTTRIHPIGLPKHEPEWDKGITYLRAALIIEPDYHPASYELADALIHTNQTDEGMTILQTLAKNQDDYGRFAQKKLAKLKPGTAK